MAYMAMYAMDSKAWVLLCEVPPPWPLQLLKHLVVRFMWVHMGGSSVWTPMNELACPGYQMMPPLFVGRNPKHFNNKTIQRCLLRYLDVGLQLHSCSSTSVCPCFACPCSAWTNKCGA